MFVRPGDRSVSDTQSVRRVRRRQRHWRRRLAESDMIPSVAAKWCQSPVGDVEVVLTLDGATHVSGVKRCASPWGCPVCAPVSRERRADEIFEFAQAVIDRGGVVQLATVTMQHSAVEDPKRVVEDLQTAWSKTWNGEAMTEFRQVNGMVGKVRAIEFTYGTENGWHPHIHALLFFLPPDDFAGPGWSSAFHSLPDATLTRKALSEAWRVSVFRNTGRSVSRRVGVDVQNVDSVRDAAGYLTEGGWQVGRELARSDLKKSAGRWSPFELLTRAAATNDPWATSVWCAYETMTYGLRFLQWDPGLRARLGFAEAMTDTEAVEVTAADIEVHRQLIPHKTYFAAWASGREAELIEQVEREWWAKRWNAAAASLTRFALSLSG